MPTPNDTRNSPPFIYPASYQGTPHTTCPPENTVWRSEDDECTERDAEPTLRTPATLAQHDEPESSTSMDLTIDQPASSKMPHAIGYNEDDMSSSGSELSELSSSGESADTERPPRPERSERSEKSESPEPTLPELIPTITSSFLRPFSKFHGQQESEKQMYQVDVEIKGVDMAESTLCGYLKIQGLTLDHPTLTTYFSGEIIGPKYTFQTHHPSWGATDKTDMQHWARFPAWRPLAKQAKKPDFHYKNYLQRENIFMRWKESFLVPDHRVREISGASFEGFYYICFNQVSGDISGIYFHAKSERYQKLELKHVPDKGCFPAMEFR
ncbi:MAG: hypothetical protein LQ352_004053 [Teloschistes flavicans]|nr:MAG: hypothetical protein LQ352_004053 [Teloschistes flavicans]